MTDYGPEQRRLLETTASGIYANAVSQGRLPAEDLIKSADPDVRAALQLLLEMGLLTANEEATEYLPVDPATVQSRIVVPIGQQGAELLAESARWADVFASLGQAFRTSPHVSANPMTELRGFENINNFIQATVADCRRELLTAQPYGRRPAQDLAVAAERDIRALDRGITMRTLYQHTARHSPATRQYVGEITAHGAEVRTLDEFFKRLIVVDRRVAIIPGSESHNVAVAVHNRSLIDYLVDMFERSWERARPFTSSGVQTERTIASDVRAMTIRMLVEGHSDPVSAKRLGVSTRTYAAYIAQLKEEYGVQTRFQLGFAMSQRVAAPGEVEADEALSLEELPQEQ